MLLVWIEGSLSLQFLICEILNLGDNLTLWKLVGICWKFLAFCSFVEYYFAHRLWTACHQFLNSEIRTLGHNLSLWKLVGACWKKMVSTNCYEYYFCWVSGGPPINSRFPRIWMSVIISLFENLFENLEGTWFFLALKSTSCAHGRERVPINFRFPKF